MSGDLPVYLLQLGGDQIDGSGFSCTGTQIAAVLDVLLTLPEAAAWTWYAAAIDVFGPPLEPWHTPRFHVVEAIADLVERIRSVNQLLGGVVIAMPDGSALPEMGDVTADGVSEKLVGGSVLELHAFDTTWIEVYADRADLLERLAQQYAGASVQRLSESHA
ncbi:hypothetical protein D3874_03370 [Oleomonas cavernae]|uniref:Uncharacterized protein n=1 Tax=Oleomonas cavernae TaxID=2320859 RepID=A0A418WUK1_9PROT|nr:hypothetical protein [Oleomonas cavernae]RJF94866.1 hypothetical protein D3874_03370 [Oleomonas cavernae]